MRFSAGIVLLFAYYLSDARFGYGADFPRTALFPLAVGIPSFALAALVLVQELRGHRRAAAPADADIDCLMDKAQ